MLEWFYLHLNRVNTPGEWFICVAIICAFNDFVDLYCRKCECACQDYHWDHKRDAVSGLLPMPFFIFHKVF